MSISANILYMSSSTKVLMSKLHQQTLCEVQGELVDVGDPKANCMTRQQLNLPNVQFTLESLRRPTVGAENSNTAFLEQNQTLSQRVHSAWLSQGFHGVLSQICEEEAAVAPWIKKSCHYLLVSLRWLNSMQITLFPHLKMTNEELAKTFSENNDWLESPIRHFAWHPHACKFAIALLDDTLRIYYNDNDLVPMLKHKQQRGISDVKWKPFSSSALAVATQTAILVWQVDPCSLSARPSSGAVSVLTLPAGSGPVTSVEWSPHGHDLLFFCSALSTAVMVWNTSMENASAIQHVSACAGVSRLLFSPEGSKVLAMTPSASFRVFESATWGNERWSKLEGRVQAACWTPGGTTLLFALHGQAKIYTLSFEDSRKFDRPRVDGSKHASVAIDLTPDVDDRPANYIHSIAMDRTGERLAVLFDQRDPRCQQVALFSTTDNPLFTASPSGFIHGAENQIPNFIQFKPHFDGGACLTICYTSGQITHVPLYFAPRAPSTANKRSSAADSILSPMTPSSSRDFAGNSLNRTAVNRTALQDLASTTLWTSPSQQQPLSSPTLSS